MKLGILVTGHVTPDHEQEHGSFPSMFDALYRTADPAVETEAYAVVDGVFPPSVTACEAWLVTGSKFGVYDPEPWIPPLKAFLRQARTARVPLIGVCFGHQIMAEAFGGRAIKSDKGWGCGVHRYQILQRPDWMGAAGAGFAMHAMHQDQVVDLPSDAVRLATSAFCDHAMVAYGDAQAPDAISIQPHPEFSRAYAEDLVRLRTSIAIPDAVADAALASFGTPVDGLGFAEWSLAYLRQALATQAT